ncbi:MAG TPA: hypothetical protein VGA61_01220 [Anaerolineae bacterium]
MIASARRGAPAERIPAVVLLRGSSALAGLGYLALTLALTYPLLLNLATAIPGDSFDGWQNYWNQWWIKTALIDRHSSPYFTDLLYAPTGVSLLFHTLNPFNGLLTMPVQLSWGPIPAYNAAVLFSFVAGGLGAYLLARQVLGRGRGSREAAFVAGAIFTFAPFHFAHLLGHLQLIALEWLPFYALYVWRLVVPALRPAARSAATFAWRDALLAGLFLVLIGLCDWYYVMYSLILTVLALVWAGWHAVRQGREGALVRAFAGAALAGTVFLLVLGPLVLPMMAEARQLHFMVPDPNQSRLLSADLIAFVTPQEFHPLWGAWARQRASVFTASRAEHQVFAGYSVLAMAGMGVWAATRRGRSRYPAGPIFFWPAAAVVFLVLGLGPVLHLGGRSDLLPGGKELPLPYAWLVSAVPFMNISRSVSRFDVMVMLALAVATAIGLQWLLSRWRRGGFAAAIALALVVFEFWPAPFPFSPPDTPAWYVSLAHDPRPGAVLNLPMNWDRPWYLLYETVHRKPLAVAYISRDDPRTLTERAPVLQHFRHLGPDIVDFDLAAQGQQVLADLGIRWLVLDRYKMPGGRERTYTEEAAREIFAGQSPVYHDERLTVYEVRTATGAAPYAVLGTGWGPLVDGSRAFFGSAPLEVHSPVAGHARLVVTLAPESAELDGPAGDGQHVYLLQLQAGTNEVRLAARRAGERIVVSRLSVAAIP